MKKTKLLVTTLVSILATCGCNNEVSSSTSSKASNSTIESTSSSKEDTSTSSTSSQVSSSTVESTSSLVTYEMIAKTINNNILKKVSIEIYDGDELKETLKSDYYGKASITLLRGTYTAKLKDLPSGMYCDESFTLKEGEITDLVCLANPIKESMPAGHLYSVGDLMYDFSFFNTKSKKVSFSSLLENKKGVIINFWGTTCVPCQEEFPHFEELNSNYGDDVSIIALSVEDGIKSVINFEADHDYTFTMGVDIGAFVFRAFLGHFGDVQTGSYSIPATVFVDKYGFINELHKGSYPKYETLENDCKNIINKYE